MTGSSGASPATHRACERVRAASMRAAPLVAARRRPRCDRRGVGVRRGVGRSAGVASSVIGRLPGGRTSPGPLVAVAEVDGDRVGEQRDHEQDDDGRGGVGPELVLRLARPVVDDDRQRGVAAGERRARSRRSPENDPRTAPARRSGAVSPSARDSASTVPVRMPGDGGRQHELAGHLPARRADAVAGLADRDRARRAAPRPT